MYIARKTDVDLGLGIEHGNRDGRNACRKQIFHEALLNRGVASLGIFEEKLMIGKLFLRLVDASFCKLPEI